MSQYDQSDSPPCHYAHLCVVQVTEDIQRSVLTDREDLSSSPALCWGFWHKHHTGALHTLKTQQAVTFDLGSEG